LSETRAGGARARNLGTTEAKSPVVAYLDDDDSWHPQKVERQLYTARAQVALRSPFLVTTRVRFVRTGGSHAIYPTTPLPVPEELGNWLVERRHVRYGTSMIQSSTLMMDTHTARTVGWDVTLAKHQDWDFVLRAARAIGSIMSVPGDPLVEVRQGTNGSVSRNPDWQASAPFLARHPDITGRARADFVLIHIAGAAIEEGGLKSTRRALAAAPLQAIPHHGAIAVMLRSLARRSRAAVGVGR
jgi:glycosyltransferase involved in cell wall biosynthesis